MNLNIYLKLRKDTSTPFTNFDPSTHGEGRCTTLPPLFFAFYSKYLEATHTRKFLTLQTFFLRMLYEKNSFTRSQITLKFRSKNRSWTRGWIVVFFIYIFKKKHISDTLISYKNFLITLLWHYLVWLRPCHREIAPLKNI